MHSIRKENDPRGNTLAPTSDNLPHGDVPLTAEDRLFGAPTPPGPLDRIVGVQERAKCHVCGRFVSKKELAKVPRNGVPWCDECASACDSPWY